MTCYQLHYFPAEAVCGANTFILVLNIHNEITLYLNKPTVVTVCYSGK